MVDVSPQAFHDYLKTVKAEGTARKYGQHARTFIETAKTNGYDTFDEMPINMLSDYVTLLHGQGLAPATVAIASYAVKKYITWVRGLGVQVPNFTAPELPKIPMLIKESLTLDEVSLYFKLCDQLLDEPVRSAAMLLPVSGLRAEEMAHLRLADIRKERIRFKDGRVKETLTLWPYGKGGKERVVPLLNEGVEILLGYLAGWRKRYQGPYVFPSTASFNKPGKGARPIDVRTLRAGVQQIREALGMDFTPHTMRRTYLTVLWRKGVDVATIAKIAGHANVQTLIKHYLTLDSEDITSAVHNKGGSLEA